MERYLYARCLIYFISSSVLWTQTNESREWQQQLPKQQFLYTFLQSLNSLKNSTILFAKLPLFAACFLQGLIALFFGLQNVSFNNHNTKITKNKVYILLKKIIADICW